MKRLFLVLTLLFPLTGAAQRSLPVEADRIVAIVGSEAITLHELRTRMTVVERQLRTQKIQLPPRESFERQLLERMIVDRLQVHLAKETGLSISDGELDAALRRIAENNRLSPQDFRAALEKDGIPWAKFREEIREEITLSRLRDREVENRIVVSEGEIDNYLADISRNTSNASENSQVKIAHILVRVPEQADAAKLARYRERAEKALAQIQGGDDFSRVAATFSDAPDANVGGMMELRATDRLPTLYAEAVSQMKPGEVTPVLRSPAGFHLVKLIERQGGGGAVQAIRQTHARHILLKVGELTADEEAKHKLIGLKERLDNGGDFAELAKLHSNDLSATKGGDLGWMYEGDTVPDFERAMDALKINEISAPVRSPFGWHLIQVMERRTEDASLERKRLTARATLRERRSDEAYQDWLRQLRDQAYVEYRLEER
ncbi:MAG: peptidylprolyl isomerase [Rhodocyclaceae bacterium]|nr:peptidylprolyl isomerase [Rhodocyclaceae bacterium]